MPIRGSPNGARHPRPQAGRNRPEWVVAINRNAWSQSIGIAGRDHPDVVGVGAELLDHPGDDPLDLSGDAEDHARLQRLHGVLGDHGPRPRQLARNGRPLLDRSHKAE